MLVINIMEIDLENHKIISTNKPYLCSNVKIKASDRDIILKWLKSIKIAICNILF